MANREANRCLATCLRVRDWLLYHFLQIMNVLVSTQSSQGGICILTARSPCFNLAAPEWNVGSLALLRQNLWWDLSLCSQHLLIAVKLFLTQGWECQDNSQICHLYLSWVCSYLFFFSWVKDIFFQTVSRCFSNCINGLSLPSSFSEALCLSVLPFSCNCVVHNLCADTERNWSVE